MSLLDAEGLRKSFGGVQAVDAVDVRLEPGLIYGVIGPNGSGKTTLLNLISGFLTADAGRIRFRGQDVTNWPAYKRARVGMARVFQAPHVLEDHTVRQNVALGTYSAAGEQRGSVDEVLARIDLRDVQDDRVGELPYARQRSVEIARAVVQDPALLLLDEAASGMTQLEQASLSTYIRELAENRDLAVMVIEHDAEFVFGLSDFVYVLDVGQVIATGSPGEISKDERVIEAYLGEGYGDR